MRKLFNIAKVKTNYPDADFWLIRKGSESNVGKPTRIYSPEHFGIKVEQTQIIIPDYLYYALTHLHNVGYFRRIAKGTLNLKHVTRVDVESIRLG